MKEQSCPVERTAINVAPFAAIDPHRLAVPMRPTVKGERGDYAVTWHFELLPAARVPLPMVDAPGIIEGS
jgi:hypothetical protein